MKMLNTKYREYRGKYRRRVDRLLNNWINFVRLAVIVLLGYLAERAIVAIHRDWVWVTVDSEIGRCWATVLKSIGPELSGIVIGLVIIDWINEKRQERQLREQLVLQMGSRHNDVTDSAVRVLAARGWLYDGSIRHAVLYEANLGGANLTGANLSKTDLFGANLVEANLLDAKLSKAHLGAANLEGANLTACELNGAILKGANLAGTELGGAKFNGASMFEAYLVGAINWTVKQFRQASDWTGATMPYGTKLRSASNPSGPTFEQWAAAQSLEDEVIEDILKVAAATGEAE